MCALREHEKKKELSLSPKPYFLTNIKDIISLIDNSFKKY